MINNKINRNKKGFICVCFRRTKKNFAKKKPGSAKGT